MTHADSAAERPKEPAGTGGVHTVSKEEKSDSNKPVDIKSEPKIEQKASNKPTKLTHNNVLKPYTTRSHSAMRINPSATTNALQQLNTLTSGTNNAGVQTCSWNPNVAPIKLDNVQGGITLKIRHPPMSGQSGSQPKNKTTNLLIEFSDVPITPSNPNSSNDTVPSAYNFFDSPSTVLPTNTGTPDLTYSMVTPTTPKPTIDKLCKQFEQLYLNEPLIPKQPNPTLALSGDMEPTWTFINNEPPTPTTNSPTVAEALSGPNAEEWWKAMAKEVSTLKQMGTYKLTDLPPKRKAMGNKWVLVLKHNKNGTPIQHKARLVAQGFSQQPGIDFDKTFAPVVRLDSIRTLVSIANQYNWDIQQLDVNLAYLHAKVDKDLYMQQIPYFSDGTNKVLKLKQSIYGLKQAGWMWNKLYDTKLKAIGYTPCFTNACVYHQINNINGELCVSIIATHVDNSIVISLPNHSDITISKLLRAFDMRNLGPIHHFLGIAFQRNRKNGIITLNQAAYINSLVDYAGLAEAYPANTPFSPTVQLT
ncbi:Reverse transcriptase (RNA-dependent DNA polymerase) [Rhizoctonia solani]|uniref:Reverse transcriptase (RNA-dependent DNA polymerase) n=1 Tax=Rhizoctonia solani TaxID=456999 RepID=A0A8H7H3F3_9AGAM|nr:Reverse transcriptase (RNA-dependent DNA polymerase) [Rhizoctonia solani]